jgi:predicted nuclease of predicted toxin-antitoxin system
MKFIIDNALSPLFSKELIKIGYDSVHVRDYQMQNSIDEEIFERAFQEDRVIITADMDFGTIHSNLNQNKPSIIIFRRNQTFLPKDLIKILLENINQIIEPLDIGAIVIFDKNRIRVRYLPITELVNQSLTVLVFGNKE